MKTRKWLVSVLMLICVLLAGCAAPATATPAPTSAPATAQPAPTTQPEPTQPAPTATSVPSIPDGQVVISVDNETFNATITGNGEIGVILADTIGYDPLRWLPLIDALDGNETLRMITFAYRDEDATPYKDTRAVLDYLRGQGIDKIICVGAGYGATACGYLQAEPEMIGMVFLAGFDVPNVDADFPKLFLTADTDPHTGAPAITQRAYEQSAEPKVFKSYAAGVHGPALFTNVDVGPQVLADITDFINGIANGQ